MILAPDDLIPQDPAARTPASVGLAWASCRRELKAQLLLEDVATVAILVGIPGAGKSRWCREHDRPGLVIFDACWATRGKRVKLAAQIRRAGKVAVAVWVRTPFEVCRERNAARPLGRRVPDAALARAWVALRHQPPVLAEGWSRVLVQNGEAVALADAAVPVDVHVARIAARPATQAWALIRGRLLPAYRAAKAGGAVPASIERSLAGIGSALKRGQSSDQQLVGALERAGGLAEARGRRAWERAVSKATGSPFEADELEPTGWADETAVKVGEIRGRLGPGLEGLVSEAWRKGWSAPDLERHLKAHGLPLEGGGTAEGRGSALGLRAAQDLDREVTRGHQEASGEDEYVWTLGSPETPRPEHVPRAGKVYRWSDPPPGGHPGEEPGCQCKAVPKVSAEGAKRLGVPATGEWGPDQVDIRDDVRDALPRFIAPEMGEAERVDALAALVGLEPKDMEFVKISATVTASGKPETMSITGVTAGGGDVQRELSKHKGRWVLHNELIDLGDRKRFKKGTGTLALARQMKAARSLGITAVETDASGSKDDERFNGYYTWPRLGYDGPIPSSVEPPAHLLGGGEPPLVSELMATAEGRAWWREHGRTFEARFDPDPRSRSSRVLEAYIKEAGLR